MDQQKVVREILRSVNEHAGSYRHLCRYRDTLIEQGMLPEARSVLLRLILRVPPHEREVKSMLWSMLAGIAFRLELLDEAKNALDNAFGLDDKNDQAWEIKALSLWKSGELMDACGAMKIALSHAMNAGAERRAHLFRSYSEMLRLIGREDAARRYHRLAQNIQPAP
ncbi:hypothetical protein A3E39_00670 [Candidatus Uhrbacteria bacterium RIFCSPHIGHO2_12_FULL_60_25]|uniref:Tetratrico peptide repeat group 5 domain-containing protein n=1 Tax=Candidatus Uhrbacteria bacterium RIFCSPHIGHO2_12_FULL_60_25 TaxID=1802399 RepID=A0A1F7UMV5_9BACT|nr:MAG: hypothetical protein A3D73_03280 [Candidatus Uhrbacteria bacterium RIFCSPHIGHO2_02_FULL_60_44]OGL79623.1 MAG: hypothetical protein A3E39_00670 [Candidatus Uhrbacteria bacterium RIFCSPHIGHO2_12_FULL_60_25]